MARTENPSSRMCSARDGLSSRLRPEPCRNSSTGACGSSCGSHSPRSRTGLPVSAERCSIQTSPGSSAAASAAYERALKIHLRCWASNDSKPAQPAKMAPASTARKGQRQRGTDSIRQQTARPARSSTAAPEKRVQLAHADLAPRGPAMVALVGTLGALHVAQQRVHLVERELAMGAHGAMAGHGGQDLVLRALDHAARVV